MSDKTMTFTVEQLAEALNNVRCMYDLSPELIAEEVFANQPAPLTLSGQALYQDAAGTIPVTGIGQPVGLIAPAAPVAVGREPVARAFGKVCGGDAEHNTVNVRVSGPVPPELWTIGTAVTLYAAPPATQNPTGDSASPVAEQPLPHWAPCNPACDPELNGSMSKLCDCAQAKSALGDQSAAAAEQPDTVAVPRGLLEHLAGSPDLDPDCCAAYYRRQLRALLGKEGEA